LSAWVKWEGLRLLSNLEEMALIIPKFKRISWFWLDWNLLFNWLINYWRPGFCFVNFFSGVGGGVSGAGGSVGSGSSAGDRWLVVGNPDDEGPFLDIAKGDKSPPSSSMMGGSEYVCGVVGVAGGAGWKTLIIGPPLQCCRSVTLTHSLISYSNFNLVISFNFNQILLFRIETSSQNFQQLTIHYFQWRGCIWWSWWIFSYFPFVKFLASYLYLFGNSYYTTNCYWKVNEKGPFSSAIFMIKHENSWRTLLTLSDVTTQTSLPCKTEECPIKYLMRTRSCFNSSKPECHSMEKTQFMRLPYRSASVLRHLLGHGARREPYRETLRNLAYLWLIHRGAKFIFDAYVEEYQSAE